MCPRQHRRPRRGWLRWCRSLAITFRGRPRWQHRDPLSRMRIQKPLSTGGPVGISVLARREHVRFYIHRTFIARNEAVCGSGSRCSAASRYHPCCYHNGFLGHYDASAGSRTFQNSVRKTICASFREIRKFHSPQFHLMLQSTVESSIIPAAPRLSDMSLRILGRKGEDAPPLVET